MSINASPAFLVVGASNAERALATVVLIGTRIRMALPLGSIGAGTSWVPVVDEVNLFGFLRFGGINEERIGTVLRGVHGRSEFGTTATRVGENEGDVARVIPPHVSRRNGTGRLSGVEGTSPGEPISRLDGDLGGVEGRGVPDVVGEFSGGDDSLKTGGINLPEGGRGKVVTSNNTSGPDIEGFGLFSLEESLDARNGDGARLELRYVNSTNKSGRVGSGAKVSSIYTLGSSLLSASGVETKLKSVNQGRIVKYVQ